nr:MAG TPA: hypothetical protein [Bacteriophage sp.]
MLLLIDFRNNINDRTRDFKQNFVFKSFFIIDLQ